ncbi:hypothetical protein ASPZODRAFT_1450822 [Penicilliopsis zonata CBS 506.65]|uniref:Ubiquitin carboxyl-terminal hydrolase n=1 Tax=Penicilliopsis zonata CBS 506.65 TaxID=1073090 RepID=A0A1L9SQE9_9EURO|nr:hypothetical protein ASPZODRAFT_1450822 [Penicilliopsis zonata CBS 506.65]OJJ49301.1 hypothetical protein ASPZODRAFT_1450822 [Penicilliopsis zonata CBS 506.65]
MGSLFRFRNNAGTASPAVGTTPTKKEAHPPVVTPLEKHLQDMGPIRQDGSDKFFGMENYGNTCYCNSILQCLYYSIPFREAVINYPRRTPIETLEAALEKSLRIQDPNNPIDLEAQAAAKQAKQPNGQSSARGAGVPPNQPQKPEDKDSPEYKKKVALQTLPLLEPNNNAPSYGMSESLFTSLKDLFESVVGSQIRMGIVRPQQFLEVLRREHEMFRTAMHQDAHEFLNLLLNEVVSNVEAEAAKLALLDKDVAPGQSAESLDQATISTGSKTPSTTRWVHELFEGTLTSETQCLTCENVSQRDEIFLDLSVDLEQHSSVTSCLRKFSAEEMLCERNKFHCDNCGGLQEAEKRMKIKRLPRVLALHLKRFKYTEDLQRLQKLFHRVVYPYHLRLFNTTDEAEDPDRLYELYAVVVHIGGGPYHGHYVAIIKTEDRGWLLFDDEMVEPVDKNYVRNFFGDRPGLACAYVLFYQETTLEAMMKEQEQEDLASTMASMDVNDLAFKQNGFSPMSPTGLSHFHTASQIPSPHEETTSRYGLVRAPTAPQLTPHPEHPEAEPEVPQSPDATTVPPPLPPLPISSPSPLSPKKQDAHTRKEQVREEKERKAAEKERKAEQEAKRREDFKREEAEMRAAIEASKASKAEEDRRHDDNPHKLAGGLNLLKRSSKSFSHRIGGNHRERRISSTDLPPMVAPAEQQTASTAPAAAPAVPAVPVVPDIPPAIPESRPAKDSAPIPSSKAIAHDEDMLKDSNGKHGHGKWRSFSLRKKSFSILS